MSCDGRCAGPESARVPTSSIRAYGISGAANNACNIACNCGCVLSLVGRSQPSSKNTFVCEGWTPPNYVSMLRVAVVGAGAAGLCCARYLGCHADRFSFSVFEKANVVGGTWAYTDRTDLDEYGLPIHSSMNTNLRFGQHSSDTWSLCDYGCITWPGA